MRLARRRFMMAVAGSAVGGGKASLRVGGPIFLASDDPVALAREHRRLGYRAAYVPKVATHERAAEVARAFAVEDVVIAEVGAWKNMLDQDPAARKANLAYVTDRMALADEVGALTCVTIAGSMNPGQWDGPDPRNGSKEFFEATVENSRNVIDAVKPRRAKFSLEMMPWTPPRSAEEYLRLIRAIDRPAFGVHIDMCNVIETAEQLYGSGRLIEDTFKKLGRWILSCHAKDLRGHRVHLAETVPGRGGVDYTAYLKAIATYAPGAPLMLEHIEKPEEYDEGREYIFRVGRQAGISFG